MASARIFRAFLYFGRLRFPVTDSDIVLFHLWPSKFIIFGQQRLTIFVHQKRGRDWSINNHTRVCVGFLQNYWHMYESFELSYLSVGYDSQSLTQIYYHHLRSSKICHWPSNIDYLCTPKMKIQLLSVSPSPVPN